MNGPVAGNCHMGAPAYIESVLPQSASVAPVVLFHRQRRGGGGGKWWWDRG